MAFETGPAFNKYEYNSRSEVIAGDKFWGADINNTDDPVLGQGFAYAYDNIGNRIAFLRENAEMNYTANNLNQYTQRTIPDRIDVLGSAATNATVTINNLAVTRHGKYWHSVLAVTNDPDVVSSVTGHVFVAKTPEQFTYDDDGNLLSDGRWSYTWDAENRLVAMQTLSGLPTNLPVVRIEFDYDYMSRRVGKTVWEWNGPATAGRKCPFPPSCMTAGCW